jgi:hypothetical protein
MSQEITIATIAALSAIAGSVISQIIPAVLSYFDKKHQRKVLLREKYEGMSLLYADSLQWFQHIGASTSFEELLSLPLPAHVKKMQLLCSIYFPKLVDPAAKYANACSSYCQSLTKNFNPSLNIQANFQAQTREEHSVLMKEILSEGKHLTKQLCLMLESMLKPNKSLKGTLCPGAFFNSCVSSVIVRPFCRHPRANRPLALRYTSLALP